MELSTEIPKVMLKISAVLGFNGMLKYPIRPAVIINASKFGINEIIIIRTLANKMAIENVMRMNASKRLS